MMELKGTEKQIKWAEDIRKEVKFFVDAMENNVPNLIKEVFENKGKDVANKYNANFKLLKGLLLDNESSKFFIDNFQDLSYVRTKLNKVDEKYQTLEKTNKNEEYYKTSVETLLEEMECSFSKKVAKLTEENNIKCPGVVRKSLEFICKGAYRK